MIRSIIYFLTVENTQNELPLEGLLNNHHNGLPVEGCQHPPMGVHLKCMIGGGCAQNHGGSWTPAGGV